MVSTNYNNFLVKFELCLFDTGAGHFTSKNKVCLTWLKIYPSLDYSKIFLLQTKSFIALLITYRVKCVFPFKIFLTVLCKHFFWEHALKLVFLLRYDIRCPKIYIKKLQIRCLNKVNLIFPHVSSISEQNMKMSFLQCKCRSRFFRRKFVADRCKSKFSESFQILTILTL